MVGAVLLYPGELAPPPDFRYVGLEAAPPLPIGVVAALTGVAATVGTGLAFGFGSRSAAAAAIGAAVTTFVLRRAGGPTRVATEAAHAVPMAIVPWGVLVEPRTRTRVLRWAGVERIVAQITYGTDTGDAESLWSVVTVDTGRERLAGRAHGAVPLERLQAHVEAYADEAAHALALDLAGEVPGGGPGEPQIEPLLASARAWLVAAPASNRLGLAPADYRSTAARAATPQAVAELRDVLRDRRAKPVDPRAFAAVIAAELRATELSSCLQDMTSCPHPVIAAVARAAAQKLGASPARTGTLDDVAPFLSADDLDALVAWAAM